MGDPDPVKKWKKTQEREAEVSESEESDADVEANAKHEDYDYLLGMAMWNLTQEKKDELLRKKDEKHQELELLKKTTPKQLWRKDLKAFVKRLDEWEAQQEEEERQALEGKGGKGKGGSSGRDKKSKKPAASEAAPSPHGVRVVPM